MLTQTEEGMKMQRGCIDEWPQMETGRFKRWTATCLDRWIYTETDFWQPDRQVLLGLPSSLVISQLCPISCKLCTHATVGHLIKTCLRKSFLDLSGVNNKALANDFNKKGSGIPKDSRHSTSMWQNKMNACINTATRENPRQTCTNHTLCIGILFLFCLHYSALCHIKSSANTRSSVIFI